MGCTSSSDSAGSSAFVLDSRYPSAPREIMNLAPLAKDVHELVCLACQHPFLKEFPFGMTQQCLRRYVRLWLPFVAKLDSDPTTASALAPPLDIAWIWFVHMSHPQHYADYCGQHFGKVVPESTTVMHSLIHPCMKDYVATQMLWQDAYAHEEFDIMGKPQPGASMAARAFCKCEWDVSRMKLEPFDDPYWNFLHALASDIIEELVYHISLPHYQDIKFLRRGAQRYFAYLKLTAAEDLKHNARNNDKKAAATLHTNTELLRTCDMELLWLSHVSLPALYAKTCTELSGTVLPREMRLVNQRTRLSVPSQEEQMATKWQSVYPGTVFKASGTSYRGRPPRPLPPTLFEKVSQLTCEASKGPLKLSCCERGGGQVVLERPGFSLRLQLGRGVRGKLRSAEVYVGDENVSSVRRAFAGELPEDTSSGVAFCGYVVVFDGQDWVVASRNTESQPTLDTVKFSCVNQGAEEFGSMSVVQTNQSCEISGRNGQRVTANLQSPDSIEANLPSDMSRVNLIPLLGCFLAACLCCCEDCESEDLAPLLRLFNAAAAAVGSPQRRSVCFVDTDYGYYSESCLTPFKGEENAKINFVYFSNPTEV